MRDEWKILIFNLNRDKLNISSVNVKGDVLEIKCTIKKKKLSKENSDKCLIKYFIRKFKYEGKGNIK